MLSRNNFFPTFFLLFLLSASFSVIFKTVYISNYVYFFFVLYHPQLSFVKVKPILLHLINVNLPVWNFLTSVLNQLAQKYSQTVALQKRGKLVFAFKIISLRSLSTCKPLEIRRMYLYKIISYHVLARQCSLHSMSSKTKIVFHILAPFFHLWLGV